MATVYLAHDVKHERKVAIKVLHPELAASLGAERFEREITIAAGLSHPNILPLLDSGTADDLLYYVMPLVEGESLRDRIHREKQLSLDDALRITEQVAAALAYAHSRGIVHRDIKPDNIMLSSGQAVVADFGIARALGAAGGDQLTQTGMAIGTPAYMSPEQSAGEANIDARTDIYALGCVLYEMLAGEGPYTGTTPGAIIAKRLSAPIPDVRILRETVPDHIEAALRRSLAKAPADRFATALEFTEALRGDRVSGGMATVETQPVRVTSRVGTPTRRTVMGVVGAGVLAAMGIGWWMARGDRISGALDPNAIAVMPFRVGGDPAYAYLRESMLDLLNARLPAETGPHVLDSRTTLRAWRQVVENDQTDLSERDSRQVAARLGAGRLMLGNIVATPTELTVSGTLLGVSSGNLLANGSVAGPPDSLALLVNRLTAQLLSLNAGEGRERLEGLATTSLSALQEYLGGRRAYRDGDYIGAMERYGNAFGLDSNFVQAAFGLVSTNFWMGDGVTMQGRFAGPTVWRLRDQLSERDRAFLLAVPWIGPDYPMFASFARLIGQAEVAANRYPDSPEHWMLLGQLLVFQGAYSAVPDWADRAARALDRAIALDSSFATALETRLFVALLQHDAAAIRRLVAVSEPPAATESRLHWTQWAAAVSLGDSARVIELRDRFGEFSPLDLVTLPLMAIRLGIPLADGHRAVETMQRDAATQQDVALAQVGEIGLAFAEGRVQDVIAQVTAFPVWPRYSRDAYLLSMALFEAPYRQAAIDIEQRVAAAYPDIGAVRELGVPRYQWPVLNDCHGELHRVVVRRDTSGTRQAIRRLRDLPPQRPPPTLEMTPVSAAQFTPAMASTSNRQMYINEVLEPARLFGVCPLLLEALLEETSDGADARAARIDALDSLLQSGPRGGDNMLVPAAFANLQVARMREAQGDITGALAAVRRRLNDVNPGFLWTLPAFLRQEGRLAAISGDTTGAIRAYQHYLTLRTNPDLPLRPQRDSVVAELAALVGR